MSLAPDELLNYADRLAGNASPTQTELRRALSAAYYAVFHFCLTAAADMVVGDALSSTPEYLLVYRSIDHVRLRGLCDQLRGTKPGDIPIKLSGGFGDISQFARVTYNLYELRIKADYDPGAMYSPSEVRLAVSGARQAVAWFVSSTPEQKRVFLTMLMFRARKD